MLDFKITLRCADAIEFLQSLKKNSVDMVLTDPPYWTLDKHRNVGTTTRLGGNANKAKQTGWFKTINQEYMMQMLDEIYRVLKPNCHAYVMSDGQTLRHILNHADNSKTPFKNYKPIVWDKVNQGMGYHYRCRHEFFVMLDKGKNRRLNSLSVPDVWAVPMIKGGYSTEKPVSLMEIPILNSTEPLELVVDPFMGGGSVAMACAKNCRNFLGCDVSMEAVELTRNRLVADYRKHVVGSLGV
jgi:site-specific DNA-methyltransferase (adenine-specific)